MKTWWGDFATAENNYAFDYLPKLDKPYDLMQAIENMHQGKMNGYICQGFNALAVRAEQAEGHRSAGEAEVPRHHGSAGGGNR